MALTMRHAFVRAFAFLFVVVVDPFGSASWGDRQSHEIWQQFNAPHYGNRDEAQTARNAITVITYDGSDQVRMARPGTLNSIHFLEMIRLLRNGPPQTPGKPPVPYKPPRAIFVDLLMDSWAPDDKLSVHALLEDKTAYQEGCPKVLNEDGSYPGIGTLSPFRCLLHGIADLNHYEEWKDDPKCLTSELAKLLCIQKGDEALGRPAAPPILIASPIDPAARFAQQETPAALALKTVAVSVPVLVNTQYYALNTLRDADADQRELNLSPAAMLYASYCKAPGSSCGPGPVIDADAEPSAKKPEWLLRAGWNPTFAPAMDVTWGIGRSDDFFNEAMAIGAPERKCDPADAGLWAFTKTLAKILFSGLQPQQTREPCLYQHHIPYGTLRLGHADTIEQPALWNDMLGGKLLLIGMNAPESNDFVPAGPHGQLPGIYYHAMALDNLIQQGKDYNKKPQPKIGTISDQDLVNSVAVLLMSLGGGIVVALDHMHAHRPPARRHRPTWRRLATTTAAKVGFGVLWSGLCFYIVSPGPIFDFYRFNIAAISIVIIIELLIVIAIAFKPILERLAERNGVLRLLFGDIPVLPARRASRGRARKDDKPATDAFRGGSDNGPAGDAPAGL